VTKFRPSRPPNRELAPFTEPAERGQERPVDWAVPNPTMELALKDAHLVAEDNQLDVLVYFAAAA
jgi:predicted secreted hydrolase